MVKQSNFDQAPAISFLFTFSYFTVKNHIPSVFGHCGWLAHLHASLLAIKYFSVNCRLLRSFSSQTFITFQSYFRDFLVTDLEVMKKATPLKFCLSSSPLIVLIPLYKLTKLTSVYRLQLFDHLIIILRPLHTECPIIDSFSPISIIHRFTRRNKFTVYSIVNFNLPCCYQSTYFIFVLYFFRRIYSRYNIFEFIVE